MGFREQAAKWRFIYIHGCVRGAVATMGQISGGTAVDISTAIYTSFIQFAQMAASIIGHLSVFMGMSDMLSGVFTRSRDANLQASVFLSATFLPLGFSERIPSMCTLEGIFLFHKGFLGFKALNSKIKTQKR